MPRSRFFKVFIHCVSFVVFVLACAFSAFSQDSFEEREVAVSPNAPWGDFGIVAVEEPHWTRVALLWIPDRILDFLDIFRVDVGIGPAYGASVKATKYVQAGYREMDPFSVRLGLFGRNLPFVFEEGREAGISTHYRYTSDRPRCDSEFGAGADLIVAGVHAGICSSELIDFLAGIATLDTEGDDFQ